MSDLENKVVLVTGAAGGIGQACARQLAAQGARLVLADLDIAELKRLEAELPGRHLCVEADVSEDRPTSSMLEAALSRFGRIDGALLNAGIEGQISPIEETALSVYDCVMRINVRGVWLALSKLLPLMRVQQSGSIVITSSASGLRGSVGQGAYVASKHAVLGLMKVAALEGGPHGVRVNAVCPGPTETRMMSSIETGLSPANPEEMKRKIVAGLPLKRYGTPDEIASMQCFLLSDAASFCTGSAFSVDGGAMAGPIR